MFKSIKDWLDLKFDLIKESLSIYFTNYKGLWENQNIQMDAMRCQYGKETRHLNSQINELKRESSEKDLKIEKLENELKQAKEEIKIQKSKSKERYLDLMNKYQDATLKCETLIEDKRKLASSKGGLNSKIKNRDKKITKLDKENKDIKALLQKVVKESKNRLTPPTRKELENYDLFGNRKGKRK